MYGPTETTVWSAVSKVEADQPLLLARPLRRLTLRAGCALQLVPVGCLASFTSAARTGAGVSAAAETYARRFLDDPLVVPGPRRKNVSHRRFGAAVAHGSLEFLGRLDHQVKMAGPAG